MTAEATTTADNQIYQITNTAKQVLDRDTTPTVLVGGIATAETYTINYLNGKITFATVDGGRAAVTITGKYLPMTTAAYAYDNSKKKSVEIKEVTPYGSEYRQRMPLRKFASGTIKQFYIADTVYEDALTAGDPIVIEIKSETSADPERFWAMLDGVQVQSAIADVQNQTITWISHDEWLNLGE